VTPSFIPRSGVPIDGYIEERKKGWLVVWREDGMTVALRRVGISPSIEGSSNSFHFARLDSRNKLVLCHAAILRIGVPSGVGRETACCHQTLPGRSFCSCPRTPDKFE
jgi:hypothetical protein